MWQFFFYFLELQKQFLVYFSHFPSYLIISLQTFECLKTAKKKDTFGVKKKINLKFGVYLLISDFSSSNFQSQKNYQKLKKPHSFYKP